ncbi:methionyl-tRNA formyltransferase [Ravibacter arvi]|uniref:Methionyl-tRNA formyltransferase n=1 Tax=Ravibacter arvi TaxID=2051041 RepID=A0ABP8MB01_9BACT
MEASPRIVFMGTPDFAVASLKALVEAGKNVVAVITAADKPAGRGLKLTPSPVKVYAASQGLKVLQPEKLRNRDFLQELRSLSADLFVVVAFRMLPEAVWSMPRLGTFNLHASLLPQYRGAAPINWAVINGEEATGVSTFLIEKEIDTGRIIFQDRERIHPEDTAGDLYERLMQKGAALVVKTVDALGAGSFPSVVQDANDDLRPAPKLFREDGQIDWQKDTSSIYNLVRGLSPYPAAWTTLDGLNCKIYRTEKVSFQGSALPGDYVTDGKSYLYFKTGDGWLAATELQLEGKRKMGIADFLRGYKPASTRS